MHKARDHGPGTFWLAKVDLLDASFSVDFWDSVDELHTSTYKPSASGCRLTRQFRVNARDQHRDK